jgi:hypothetical protein
MSIAMMKESQKMIPICYNLRALPWVGPQPQQLRPKGDLNIAGNEVSNQGGLHSGQTH